MGQRWTMWIGAVAAAALTVTGVTAVQAGEPPSPTAGPLTPKVVDGRIGDWVGESTMVGGTTRISRGELVHQDHVYDDAGPETRQRSTQRSTFEGRLTGDYRYPTEEDRFANNVADILEVRLAADAGTAWVLVRLNSLRAADTTVAGVAIDVDPGADPATGGGSWPFAAGLTTTGSDHVLTVVEDRAVLTTLATGEHVELAEFAWDTTDNAVEVAVPRSLVTGDTWRVHAATGLWDATAGEAGEWMLPTTGAPTDTRAGYGSPLVAARAFNAAFRSGESGPYMEDVQAAVLAGGDISDFSHTVDLGRLVAGETEPFSPPVGEFFSAIVEESFTVPPLDEGMSFEGVAGRGQGLGGAALTQTFNYFGPHQPYGVYLPTGYDGSAPMPTVLVLHGHGGSHSGVNTNPNFLAQMGENPGGEPTILVSPLGRGSSMYSDYGEKDVLEVLDDASARFAIDPDRLYLAGYSMGGHGVYRLGTLYPDRFAAGVSWAGYTGEFTGRYLTYEDLTGDPGNVSRDVWQPIGQPVVNEVLGGDAEGRGKAPSGNPVDVLENLRYFPLLHMAGTNDEILPVTGQYAAPRRLEQLGYRHRFDLYPGYEHLTFALVDDWTVSREWLGDARRATRPRHVTYKYSEAFTDPALPVDLGLVHGQAWWLAALHQRDDAGIVTRYVMADLTSHAVPEVEFVPVVETSAEPTPTPHVRRGVAWPPPGTEAEVANALTAVLENARLVEIDAAGAGLDPGQVLTLHVTTDGPVTLVLRGAFGGVAVTGGPGVSAKATGQALTIELADAGEYVIDARPRRPR